jgi:hypothetical protein
MPSLHQAAQRSDLRFHCFHVGFNGLQAAFGVTANMRLIIKWGLSPFNYEHEAIAGKKNGMGMESLAVGLALSRSRAGDAAICLGMGGWLRFGDTFEGGLRRYPQTYPQKFWTSLYQNG